MTADLIRTRVMLPPGSPVERGPQWTDLWIREGTSDEAVLDEIWVQDVYRARGLGLTADPDWLNGNQHPVVVDLGANIGCFTALICAMYPDVRVVAVEPEPGNLRLLMRNVAPFGDRVEVFQVAVGGSSCPTALVGDGATAHTVRVSIDTGPIPTVTLAHILADHERVALGKCDIEAAEYETFLAMPTDVLAKLDRIAMEWHGPETCPWVEGHMERHYGALLTHLARTHAVQTFGHPHRGGMLFATRYDLEGRS